MQQRLLVVIQFFIVRISVPMLVFGVYVMSFAQRSVGLGMKDLPTGTGIVISEEVDVEPDEEDLEEEE